LLLTISYSTANSNPHHNVYPAQMFSRPPRSLILRRASDEYFKHEYPELNHHPLSQQCFRGFLFANGATEDTLEEFMNEENAAFERLRDTLSDRRIILIGRKLIPGVADVLYYPIPNTELALRVYSGGMETSKEFCFDFFDRALRGRVHTPAEIEVYNVDRGLALYSWLMPWGNSTPVLAHYCARKARVS